MVSTTRRLTRGGLQLPYDLLAGIVPCPAGWLVLSAKLQGITLSPQAPEVFKTFIEVLDYRPSFVSMALVLPLGLPSRRTRGGRTCDRQARQLLKWPRASAIASPPTWQDVDSWQAGGKDRQRLSVVTRSLMPRIHEVYEHLGSYHQRTLFEVHPELSFLQINEDQPLRYSKHTSEGQQERKSLLRKKMPGIDRVLSFEAPRVHLTHVLDAAASLWTARRILSKAVHRLPEAPEWDERGFRMEFVR